MFVTPTSRHVRNVLASTTTVLLMRSVHGLRVSWHRHYCMRPVRQCPFIGSSLRAAYWLIIEGSNLNGIFRSLFHRLNILSNFRFCAAEKWFFQSPISPVNLKHTTIFKMEQNDTKVLLNDSKQ